MSGLQANWATVGADAIEVHYKLEQEAFATKKDFDAQWAMMRKASEDLHNILQEISRCKCAAPEWLHLSMMTASAIFYGTKKAYAENQEVVFHERHRGPLPKDNDPFWYAWPLLVPVITHLAVVGNAATKNDHPTVHTIESAFILSRIVLQTLEIVYSRCLRTNVLYEQRRALVSILLKSFPSVTSFFDARIVYGPSVA
jgi:hypothetical protein